MEAISKMDWESITSTQKTFDLGTILHNYDKYVCEIDNENELGNIIGMRYFTDDYCIDEIMEEFVAMVTSDRSSGLIHHLSFAYFFLQKSFYNKMVSRDEFLSIFRIYFGVCDHVYTKGKSIVKSEYKFEQLQPTNFLSKLPNYNNGSNTEQENDMVYDNMYKLLIELKYEI